MSLPDEPRQVHFTPDPERYTERIVVGPKFLASLFRSKNENEEKKQKHRFAKKLIELIRDEEVAYRDIRVNQHVLDEAATKLKDKCSPTDAFKCVNTVRDSNLFTVDTVSDEIYSEACNRFVEYDDHGGAFTDFITTAYTESHPASYLATWDSHYREFDSLLLLPNCAHP